ncbi:MAG: peptidoglycan-binding protein [Aristaeellaceae bacterium]
MKKLFLAIVSLTLALTLCCGALADAVISGNGYAAYLGESNYLYLRDPSGVSRILRAPIKDLVSMNDTELFCLAQSGQLYGIMLDASGTRIVAAAPTEADLAAVATAQPYTLEETVLSVLREDGVSEVLSSSALAACSNGATLFYIEQGAEATTLKAYTLGEPAGLITDTSALHRVIGAGVAEPLSITATEDAVAIVAADHSIVTVNLADNSYHTFPATSQETTVAVSIGNKLVRLHEDTLNGGYVVEMTSDNQTVVTATPAVTVTPTPTTMPTATPATVTAKPTATPKPTNSTTTSDDGRISKGASGSSVRKMQQRLADLGYPVGKVDGVFGDNTLIAVHLFQFAIGYTQRSYASSAMLDKLYGKNAPAYDRFMALESGDKGEPVKILQQMLFDLGYLGKDEKEIDGAYGKRTSAAVKAFQTDWKLEPATGEADKVTMEKLCELADLLAAGQPVVPPTDAPTTAPTEIPTPTQVPEVTPPATPTPTPTQAPTATPTVTPTQTPGNTSTSTDL